MINAWRNAPLRQALIAFGRSASRFAKGIAEAHGGSITLTSEAVIGTVVSVRLARSSRA